MKKVSLNELMGKVADSGRKKLSMDDLPELLGDRMPKIEYSPVGKIRLMQALRNRFGDSYKNLNGMDDVIRDFEERLSFNVKLQEMKAIKAKR